MNGVAFACLLLGASPVAAQEWSVASPNGRTAIHIALRAGGRLVWRATRDGATVLDDAPLALTNVNVCCRPVA